MSVKTMGLVWDLDLPHNEQCVLLAMADHANHEGGNVFPSNGLVAWKTGLSKDTVRRSKKKLESKKILVLVRATPGQTKCYRIDISAGPLKPPFKNEELTPSNQPPPSNTTIETTTDTPSTQPPHPLHSSATPPLAQPCYPNHHKPSLNPTGGVEDEKNHEKRKFMAAWKDAYRFKFRTEYSPTNRGADEATASRRIKEGNSSDYLMTLARSAWAAPQDGNHWACNNRSFFIADFLNALPRIKIELTNQVARKNYGTNANAGTLNAGKASQYRGVGRVVPATDHQRTGP